MEELNVELTLFEKIIFCILRKYSIKIYKLGVKRGFNWNQ